MITSEIEDLKEAIDEASAADLRKLAAELCEKAEELERDNQKLSDENNNLHETIAEQKRTEALDYQVLQLKHPRLFTGDLSRLTHADRRELFEEIYNFEGHSDALSRIEHSIS